MLIEAIDTWLKRKLLKSLKSSPYFTVMADECQDISSQEELSICFRWLIDGCPEEHYLTTLHVKSTDAETITAAITAHISEKNLDYQMLVGQGYDGASTFSRSKSGVQRRIRIHAAHDLYVHCCCCNWPLFKQQSLLTPLRRCLVPWKVCGSFFITHPKKLRF